MNGHDVSPFYVAVSDFFILFILYIKNLYGLSNSLQILISSHILYL
jgi:hypothetical protein